jgi:hypothetical protein
MRGQRRVIPGFANQLIVLSEILTPHAILLPLARRMMAK